jgi:tryptophanyl-tRNA synthetase
MSTTVDQWNADLETRIAAAPHRFRVLTGDRPTGARHLGHYFGTLANRVRLQDLGVETYLVIADYQVITDRDVGGDLPGNVRELLLDQLAAGIDPARTTIVTHSAVPALNQLLLPLLSLISVAELQRNPTVKAETAATGTRAMSGLMLTYPVHQAADILFCSASVIPVGHDQLAHLEVARTLVRRFDDRARTDGDRRITYDPVARPEVANLLELAGSASTGRPPSSPTGSATAARPR